MKYISKGIGSVFRSGDLELKMGGHCEAMLGKKKFENFRSSITVIWKPRSSIGALSILTKLDISILHHRPSLQYCPVLSGLHHLNSTIDFFFSQE